MFAGSMLRGRICPGAVFEDCRFEDCRLAKVDFGGSIFRRTEFAGTLREVIFGDLPWDHEHFAPNEYTAALNREECAAGRYCTVLTEAEDLLGRAA